MKKVSFAKFPIQREDKFIQAYEIEIPSEELYNVADTLRIIPQIINMNTPYVFIPPSGDGTIMYENGKQPIMSYSIPLEMSLLPLNHLLNDGQLKKKACYVVCNEFNEFDDLKTITSHDLKLYIGKELSAIPLTEKKYLVSRLRKGERLSFKGDIRSASATIAPGSVIHTPYCNYDGARNVFQIQFESRGYWNISTILNATIEYLQNKYKKYRTILLEEPTEENKKQYGYTILNKENPKVFMHREITINNDDEVDFELAIKNALSNHINTVDGLLFNFEYETNKAKNVVTFLVEKKDDLQKVKKIFQEQEAFVNKIAKGI